MDTRMYDTLTSIPLFQGICGWDLNQILENVHIDIEYLERDEVFIHQGDSCQYMIFVINGTLWADSTSQDGTYTFSEEIKGPATLEPDILYGIQRTWSSTYTATETCRLMKIPKEEINRMMVGIEVFRLNYLNTLCTLATRRKKMAWKSPSPTLRERFCQFVAAHAITPTGPKRLTIRMRDIGEQLGATRSLISKVLHAMEQDKVLTATRGCIDIPQLENLK